VAAKDTKDKSNVEHSAQGVTTRDDATDLGVPMLAGDPSEPVGPEDALGEGPKRGDYSKRLGDAHYQPHTVRPIPADEREENGPTVRVVAQAPLASEQGEEKGVKGGVGTV
jgi:hypothetical protein